MSIYSLLFTVTVDEIDKCISDNQDTLSSLPRSSYRHAALLSTLASLRLDRFLLLDDEQDLKMSILQFSRSIFMPFPLSTGDDPNIISTLYSLSHALIYRSRKYNQLSDVGYSIKYLHFLRDLSSSKVSGATRANFTTSLVYALALQVQLEPGNAIQGVEEMSILCRELLSSDLPKQDIGDTVESFARAVLISLIYQWNQPSQQMIDCLEEASMHLPDSQIISFALFRYFELRFFITKSDDDYENAMDALDKMLAGNASTDSPGPYLAQALHAAAGLAGDRFRYYEDPKYLEEALSRYRAILDSTSPGDPDRGGIIQSLVELERRRSDEFGVTGLLPEALLVDSGADGVVDPPSFLHLAASLAQSSATNFPSMTVEDLSPHLEAVEDMDRITDAAEIENAAKYCRLLLTSLQKRGDEALSMTHLTLSMLGYFFLHAYKQTNNPTYLNEAIDVFQRILEMPRARWLHFSVIRQLISSLSCRRKLSKDKMDFDEAMRLFPLAANDTCARVPDRFEVSSEWAQISRKFLDPSASAAYESAISLMQDSLTFAPTLEIQHRRLVALRDDVEKLPLDYASYQIDKGQLAEAIVTLERGRGLLWSELRGLRTSIDQLSRANMQLAKEFAAINKDLEKLTTSDSQSFVSDCGDDGSGEEADLDPDPFSHTIKKQRRLLDERTRLITRIRSIPSFENFLVPPSFEALRTAARHGPVIIINHCHWRSDIIILLHDSDPSLIPTQDDFYNCAKGLKDQLLAAQKKGLDFKAYDDTLASILKTLYDLVGRPVLQRLKELKIPDKSRIWWCPTSVFCSLPLHAMGPVGSEERLYFSDLYISSYTPSLSALIESRKPGCHLSEKPSILLVAQPDEFMPEARNEIALIRRLKTKVTMLASTRAKPSNVMKRLRDHRFAHFSCHGILETGKPFGACFKLYQGRLTLLEIIRSQLPSAEFAFLSACHTAGLTQESIADEGLHLSAAVQYSGFRSVVGTLWAMADIDGQVVTKHFYESLFSDEWKDVPYYERTAKALWDAVRELRRVRGKNKATLERWVNFVHYGA
jgi:CHAT domain-containing protein